MYTNIKKICSINLNIDGSSPHADLKIKAVIRSKVEGRIWKDGHAWTWI
jgi:hypothetical protein